jgi:hypothetical protein
MLRRSDELEAALLRVLEDAEYGGSRRSESCLTSCSLAMEHATSLRVLITMGLATSAAGLMRLQFEALTRAMWLMYAASDAAIEKLLAPLSIESEQVAKNLPSVTEMIDQIGKQVPARAPAAAHQMLSTFKDTSWHAMNSFVHGGIHSLRRHADGFPVNLALDILRNSNALVTMTAMTLAVLTGNEAITKPVQRVQVDFADCFPPLLDHAPSKTV